MPLAHLRRLVTVKLLEVVQWPTSLLLERLRLEEVLLRRVAGHHLHGRVRLLKLVKLLADFHFRARRHRLG